MKAVVLAAGKGTRMRELTRDVPKPMLEVGGRPVLTRILEGLRAAGVSQVCIVVGHLEEKITSCYRDGQDLGLQIQYRRQATLNGTGGALLTAEGFANEPFFVTFGDILLRPSSHYSKMRQAFEGVGAVLAANWVEDPSVGGAVYFSDSGMVTHLVEKPAPGTSTTHYNQAGCFIFPPLVMQALKDLKLSPRGEIELTGAVNLLLERGIPLKAHLLGPNEWLEIGTPELLAKADTLIREDDDGVA